MENQMLTGETYSEYVAKEKKQTVTVTVTRTINEEVEIELAPYMKAKEDETFYKVNEDGRADVISIYPRIKSFHFESDVKITGDLVEATLEDWQEAVKTINEFLNK
jgi:hypothetical protein